jgi:NADH dehydrogenase (ubiquinone) Fe-S protein 1
MWEISPSLLRYDHTERTSVAVALAGLRRVVEATGEAKVTGAPLRKPISNFYQTDPISRASVTMAQCTRAFVKGEDYGFGEIGQQSEAAFA